jgi:aspartate kinase
MKFGGTSVATPEGRSSIAGRVSQALKAGTAPVVVVSAMGRAGAPYATATLLGLIAALPADTHERALLMSTGEVISAVVVAHELRSARIDAHAFTGPEAGICTDGVDGASSVTEIHPAPLIRAIESGTVPVVAGFQGIAEDGRLTTLGRGGSDTTACALGVALEAEAVEIYSDVDGIMTADPRAAEDATVLERIRADELFQMAQHGSRVVHTPAAELALTSGLALRVRNTYTDHPGTTVVDISAYTPIEVATSITHTDDVARLRVQLPAAEGTPEHMSAQARVYRAMADAEISLDMFTSAGETLLFSVASDNRDGASAVLGELGLAHEADPHLAKVTLVGAGMHGIPGVMAQMAEFLHGAGVRVLQTADSHTTISVLVDEADMAIAVQALHDGYGLAE